MMKISSEQKLALLQSLHRYAENVYADVISRESDDNFQFKGVRLDASILSFGKDVGWTLGCNGEKMPLSCDSILSLPSRYA